MKNKELIKKISELVEVHVYHDTQLRNTLHKYKINWAILTEWNVDGDIVYKLSYNNELIENESNHRTYKSALYALKNILETLISDLIIMKEAKNNNDV